MKETISHYRIIRELGRGGMGEVYLAEDTRLRRNVAVKVLPAAVSADSRRVQRLLREAHAASALNHPNVAVIHEVGEENGVPFIAMEYVDGPTLAEFMRRGSLESQRIIELALQLADALEEARSRGIVHRDLKPSNIIINSRGDAKILDFGLAKVVTEASTGGIEDATDLKSDPAVILGTVQYMSPEQALGREVDHRSDLFSFGVILYEMATGRHPFIGKSTTETIERIAHAQPEAIARLNYNVPLELERIIRKCLEKDREWRYQSAREIVVDLKSLRRDSGSGELPAKRTGQPRPRWLAAAAAAAIAAIVAVAWMLTHAPSGTEPDDGAGAPTSIAVLPFSNMSSAPPLEYLRFALPDEVTTILSGNTALAVRPFATTRLLEEPDPIAAGRSLNAEKVITGHYRGDAAALAVTIEAIDVAANRIVWRNSVTLPAADLIALRNRLSTQLRTGLLPALGVQRPEEEATQPQNEEAYSLFLRASSLPRDAGPTREAIPMLERAVSLDPNYAPAWVELGRRHYISGSYGGAGSEALDRARAAFSRARSLDAESLGAMRGLIIAMTERGDLRGAYREALDAVRRRPRGADVRLALSYVLRYAGRLEDSARQCDIAYAIDRNPGLRSCYIPFMYLRKYDRARDFLRLEEGSDWSTGHLASVLIREGKTTEAAALLRQKPGLRGEGSERLARCLETGEPQPVGPRLRATVDSEAYLFTGAELAFCGASDAALELLRTALEKKYSIYPAIDGDPAFDRIRGDARFQEIRADAIRYHEETKALLQGVERDLRPPAAAPPGIE